MKHHRHVQHAIDTYRAIDAYAVSTVHPEEIIITDVFCGPPEPNIEWLDADSVEEMAANNLVDTLRLIEPYDRTATKL